ncbi:uncharacterized protein LOC129221432 [Uloborus diversus]|uniref:uncharacterized protein LOC129221432 n=1 Tax=Uloborus diversus TaxID=327109 RepID=UPI00240A180F|nr:uncharacterized protein LOC129221432 [Uloborus diversus]
MHNLPHVLVLIGDQLDIPIIREDDSDESASSEVIIDSELFGSVASTTASVNSMSSTSSRKGISTLIRHRSDIADSKKSRQILLPGTSPKKKKKVKSKQASSQKKPVRHSPRLSSKKLKHLRAEKERTARACRNLFPAGKVLQTPKKSKPSSNQDVKLRGSPRTNQQGKSFIAETPAHKRRRSLKSSSSDLQSPRSSKSQIKSSLKKKISQGDNSVAEDSAVDLVSKTSLVEIISPNPKAFKLEEIPASTSNKSSNSLELLQTLHRRKSVPTKYGMVPSKVLDSGDQSFVHYTPESKRRLSLKLFSKVLTSPTARMGLKRCSKRLFDQMSPQKEREAKKLKQCDQGHSSTHKS